MRVKLRKSFAPIRLDPGDTLTLAYDEYLPNGTKVGETRELCGEPVGRRMTVDVGAVVDLDPNELEQLGLKDGIAGVFGESAPPDG